MPPDVKGAGNKWLQAAIKNASKPERGSLKRKRGRPEGRPLRLTLLADHDPQHDHEDDGKPIEMDAAVNRNRYLLWYDLARSKGIGCHTNPCINDLARVRTTGFVVSTPLAGAYPRLSP